MGLMIVVLMLMLVLDKTKGLPLVEDALAFSVRNGGQGHSIKECSASIYSKGEEEKKSFIKAIQNLKKKIFGELPMAVGEEVLEFNHVNVYKRVTIAEKNKLVDLTRAKDMRAQCGMHFFSGEDFRTMTSMDIWWEDWNVDEILSLIRDRHMRYPEYDKMSEEATTAGGRSFTQLINDFEWDEDMINYARGIRPYPGGMD
ncbi:hypothetical protein KY284_000818 [Solanum tuberosum]|nr:hypothetical protein KY284_000818 [Solanum tuberosum]